MSIGNILNIFKGCGYPLGIDHGNRETFNDDGSVNWKKWHELLEETKLPYLVYDPPQKKVEFTEHWRNINAFPPRSQLCSGSHPCCLNQMMQKHAGPFSKLQISKDPEEWMGKLLAVDHVNCPEFLKGVFWMKDNVANETVVTFQDSYWDKEKMHGWKNAEWNWTTGTNLWGSTLAASKTFWMPCQVEPPSEEGKQSKWVALRNGDDWMYVLGEEDRGKFVYPDGKPVPFIVGEDMLRVSVKEGKPSNGMYYQYLVSRIGKKDCDGKIVTTQYYDELVERATRPTVHGCCCDVFLCNISDEQYPQLYDSLDDHQIVIYAQDRGWKAEKPEHLKLNK